MAAPISSICEREQPQKNMDLCEIEASIPTGFESTAKQEIEKKLAVEVTTDKGKANFHIPVEQVTSVSYLCLRNGMKTNMQLTGRDG